MQTGINGHTEERLKNFNKNQRGNLTMEKLQVIDSETFVSTCVKISE